jgi:fatty acid desaturase
VYYVSSDEWRGSVMLLVLAASFLYVGFVFRGALRRATVAATSQKMTDEEAPEADIRPTIWPFVISLGALLVIVGVVGARWVLIPGLIVLLASAVGWIVDIERQWHPSELHAAHGAEEASPLEGDQQPDESDRE